MANNENLKSFKDLTAEEQREIAKKGGKASGKKRRELKTMKLMLDYLLSKKIENKQGKKVTTLEAMMLAQIKQALSGNTKAAIFIRDTLGERPAEVITNTNINIEDEKVINEVLNKLKDL